MARDLKQAGYARRGVGHIIGTMEANVTLATFVDKRKQTASQAPSALSRICTSLFTLLS